MRIISWNCQDGFIGKSKYVKLLNLRPDIAIIQECAHPDLFENTFDFQESIWYGNNIHKGLCVLSFSKDYKLTPLIDDVKYDWIVPIQVSGKTDFILIAVWTQKRGYSYGKLLYSALKEYESLFMNQKVIVIGDFNVGHNLPRSFSGIGGFNTLLQFFSGSEMSSCYHFFYQEEFGQESRATHFYHRKSLKPFHIDYCFTSRAILENVKEFSVGAGEEWVEVSDHFPLILEADI